ncbi:heme exporter protein CcmD [Pararhizobium haloflavum]|uniref:heme exporter protein CcmD n=1 Tax=Pararhizobium haloflavum TaxID=2037914 RepID=UPI000C19E770|nr:heme exporter protein CcmD [Pararhizobium haloflavum]
MAYFGYIFASYLATAVALLGLIGWVVFDLRGRRADLAELEARGVRRRSAAAAEDR